MTILLYKTICGYIAIAVGLTGYSFYLRGIFSGRTKPHSFSWLLWGFLTGIVFMAQISKGGGSGAWATGVSSIVCFAIGIIAISKDRKFSMFDWIFLGTAVIALATWFITKDPTISVILVTIVDSLGYAFTLRKGYSYPQEENITSFTLNSLKFVFSIIALQNYTLITWLYPAAMIIMNGSTALLVGIRRKQLSLR